MGPKKGKRRGRNDDDQQFEESQKKVASKWADALEEIGDNEADPEQIYTKPSKTIFQFDFSHQRTLDLLQERKKPQKDKFEDYTAEELEELEKIKQQARADKQVKNQIKNEKKKQRQKQLQAQKLIEQTEKQKQLEQKKRIQEEVQKNKKKESSPWVIPLSLLGFLIFMFFLQYQKEIYEKLSKFQNNQVDYYEVLEADQSSTDKQLKNKYKKLVLKYHPDRNPDCQNCKQKFDKIMTAWEVLGDEQKRKQYDQNSGFISELKSISTTLTPYNYNYLVDESKSVWLIQVFDSTSTYSKYFSQFWQQLVMNYGDFIKFGRIDIWTQSQMSSYLPYNFKVFPSIYFNDQGYTQICTFNFESPSQGLKQCIEEALSKSNIKIVPKVPAQIPKSNKPQVFIDGKLRGNIRIKALIKMLEKSIDFFFTQKQQTPKQVNIFYRGTKFVFNFTDNSKQTIGRFSQYLQNFIIQSISTCGFLNECEQKKCILVLNKTKISEVEKQLPLNKENKNKIPVYALNDESKQLEEQINQMKQHFDNFEIGVYESGRVDLGYANEADILNPEEGERLDLQCNVYTWKDRLVELFQSVYNLFNNN